MTIHQERAQILQARAYRVVEQMKSVPKRDFRAQLTCLLNSAWFAFAWQRIARLNGEITATPNLNGDGCVNVDLLMETAAGQIEYEFPLLIMAEPFNESEVRNATEEVLKHIFADERLAVQLTFSMSSSNQNVQPSAEEPVATTLANMYAAKSEYVSTKHLTRRDLQEFCDWVREVVEAVITRSGTTKPTQS